MAGRPSDFTIRIFELLMGASLDMETVFEKSFTGEYMRLQISPEQYKALQVARRKRENEVERMIEGMREKQRLSQLISVLRTQGLIRADRDAGSGKKLISLTSRGIAKLRFWKTLKPAPTERRVPIGARTRYAKKPSKVEIIVSFDIPEKHAGKRVWLRTALKNLDFALLHESMWMGKTALPKDFISDIAKLGIERYIKIFSVVRRGTI